MSRLMKVGCRTVWVGCAALALCLGLFGMAGAAGDGGHGGSVTDLIYRIMNFALLVIILVVVVKKTSGLSFFENRKEDIRRKFEDLQKEKDSAEARCRELEEKLTAFSIEKAQILDQFRFDGAQERDRIIEQARERAAQILAQAELTVQREIQGAKERLKEEMIESAALRAQALIAQKIMDSDQDHLVTEFIERVEKLH